MAPKLVLTYFDKPGQAEATRWALVQSGLEWEDKRLSWRQFLALKPSLPNGHLPILEVDGYVLAQSMAILRYVGKFSGLYPSDELEVAKVDSLIDFAADYLLAIQPAYFEKDPAKKRELYRGLAEDFFPKWLAYLEKELAATGGIYFGEKMSVADIMIVCRVKYLKDGMFDGVPTTIVNSSYPKLNALYDSIVGEPKIAAYIAKHRHTAVRSNI